MTETKPSRPPSVIGLIGGIASGKSAVAEILGRWGADRFDADGAGHEALAQPAVLQQLRKRWGDAVVDPRGRAIRSEIARRVFADTETAGADLQFLNFVTHPWIRAAFQRHLARCTSPVLLLDAALLLEAGWERYCDEILFVDAGDETRRERAVARGWTEDDWVARESTQLPLEEKRRKATHVLDNSGSLAQLEEQLAPLAAAWGLQPEANG